MSKVVEVKQQVGKSSGKPYWNLKLDDGTYANCFTPVNVGQEGTVTETPNPKGGVFKNFAPIAQQSISSEAPKHEATDLSEMNEKLDRILEILEERDDGIL